MEEEWAALKSLSRRKNVVIKAAHKGGAVVVWRTDLYRQEAFRQLSDTSFYAKVDKDLTSANQNTVKKTIQDLVDKQELPVAAKNLIVTTPRTSRIYFKPKIHKPNNPGRPIVSACSCPTSYANLFVGYIENQFFNQFNGTKPELYGRYIDDCIDATSSSREELDHFITSVNSFHLH